MMEVLTVVWGQMLRDSCFLFGFSVTAESQSFWVTVKAVYGS